MKIKNLNYKELTNTEAEIFQIQNYKKYCDNLSQNDKNLLKYGYLGTNFININESLRGIYTNGSDKQKIKYLETANLLTNIILQAPKVPENIIVYRGLCTENYDIKEHINNNLYIDSGFLSTSLSKESVLDEFSFKNDIIMKIYVPMNASALGVDCIANRKEYELLFPPNTKLKYLGKKLRFYEFELLVDNRS